MRGWITCLALLAAGTAGCSSSGSASADAHGGASGGGGSAPTDAGADASDAAPAVPPIGVDNADGTPCPSGVTCASGLCGAGGLCLPRYVWSRRLAQGGCASSMVVSPDGNFVVFGGHPTSTPAAPTSAFIEKVDPDLNIIWRHIFGGFTGGGVTRPAVLADGTVVFAVAGAPVSFDSGMVVSHTTDDIQTVLVSISSAGAYQWFKSFPTPPNAHGSDQIGIAAVAANPGGGMTLAGGFHGQVSFDFDGFTAPIGTRGDPTNSVYVAQYDTAGKLAWVNAYPSSNGATVGTTQTAPFLGVAPDGGIYIAGGFDGTGVFGTTSQTGGSQTKFLAHLDATGSITATGSWVVNPPDLRPAVALAADGSLFQASDTDLRRIAPTTGQAVWSFPTPTLSFVGLSAATNVIVTGIFSAPTDFGFGSGQPLLQPRGPANNPSWTTFLAAYTTGGQLLWVREPNLPANAGVTIGPDGSLYYLNNLSLALTDYDPGSAVDAIEVTLANIDCIITKYAPQ